jgi:chromate reductase, NAD(P)H dehydrogenase (quinone)
MMYTIISATNRKDSNSLKVAKQYQTIFKELGIDAQLFSLEQFQSFERNDAFKELEQIYLQPTTKFIFIMPEYNGSFPGIFKLMMDISDLPTCWNNKKVMLVGVAAGRAGNLRGIDMMTNMCHYMKMDVFYQKNPISNINAELKDGVFVNESTILNIKLQVESYSQY